MNVLRPTFNRLTHARLPLYSAKSARFMIATRPVHSEPDRAALSEFQNTHGRDYNAPKPRSSAFRTVYKVFIVAGLAGGIYGATQLYIMRSTWPTELRKDLRAAVKAKHNGDNELAEAHFRKALATAEEKFSDAELDVLKRTGIWIALAALLPRSKAYEALDAAQAYMQKYASSHDFTVQERLRYLVIALRLAELAGKSEDEERWGVAAVEETTRVLNLLKEHTKGTDVLNIPTDEELRLPRWVQTTDFAVPYERLGAFYASQGRVDYAVPLYLQTLEILGPSPVSEDKCRTALVMNNLADALVSEQPSPQRLVQGIQWVHQGLSICKTAREALLMDGRSETCEQTYAALLFNAGRIAEMQGSKQKAAAYYGAARTQSQSARYLEGVRKANEALSRV